MDMITMLGAGPDIAVGAWAALQIQLAVGLRQNPSVLIRSGKHTADADSDLVWLTGLEQAQWSDAPLLKDDLCSQLEGSGST